jgi:hypothetical protein
MSKLDIKDRAERLRSSTTSEWAESGESVGVAALKGSSRVEVRVTVKDSCEVLSPPPSYGGVFRAPRACATSSGHV